MRKGSEKNDYRINPLKRELRDLYQEFYNKGYKNYRYLQQCNADHCRLLELYNRINETIRPRKPFILNRKQYSLHYRQYCYMERYKKERRLLIEKKPEQLTREQAVLNKAKEESQKATIAENERTIAENERTIATQCQDIERCNKKIKQLKKEELSYIAQQNFLSVLKDLEFYKTTIQILKNMQILLYNKINEKKEQDSDRGTQEYIVKLFEQYANIIKAYGLDKLLQLQPQVINFLKQENNNNIDLTELKVALGEKD